MTLHFPDSYGFITDLTPTISPPMNYPENFLFSNERLLGGFVAFASAGVMAAAGGNADQWSHALMYVCGACGLAVVAVFLLIKIRRNNKNNETVSEKYTEIVAAAGVSDEMFNRFYLPVVEHLEASEIQFGIAALRLRRGVYLGTQQGQENARRNRDRWTYAVFLAAVSKASERGIELVLFRTPQDARDWLLREELVFSTLVDALNDSGAMKNPINQLLTDTTENSTLQTTKCADTNSAPERTIKNNLRTARQTSATKPVQDVINRSQPVKMNSLTDRGHGD